MVVNGKKRICKPLVCQLRYRDIWVKPSIAMILTALTHRSSSPQTIHTTTATGPSFLFPNLTLLPRSGFADYFEELTGTVCYHVGFAGSDGFDVDQVGADAEGAGPGIYEVGGCF